MTTEIWASALSLTGVALGAGLTALSQRATQRSADRAEERRLITATSESRRAERSSPSRTSSLRAQEAERAPGSGQDDLHGGGRAVLSPPADPGRDLPGAGT
ncbi:hypothetical protein [Streptomyces sp. NPDC088923]|uniref:hypothetical protein n=1 Tax=Streptomyces sp. NPDC088923 TaxID=3365913 RepID=UPI003807FB91